VWLVVGAIAGWLAGALMRTGGFGLVGNIVIGIVGAVLAAGSSPKSASSSARADQQHRHRHHERGRAAVRGAAVSTAVSGRLLGACRA
jgi:F0F1-type ATP synthase assembly protein I